MTHANRVVAWIATTAAILLLCGEVLGATVYYTPQYTDFYFTSSDQVNSNDDNTVLTLDPDYTLLALTWVGPGDSYLIWCSNCDNNWPWGYGRHVGQTSFSSDGVAVMQGDGNFVINDTTVWPWEPLWATHTEGNSGAYLNVQNDTNLVIYSSSDVPLWSIF